MTESGHSQTAPRTGGFRFSLRVLFLFVLFAAVMCSHVATSLRLKQAESNLANASEELVEAKEELDQVRSENSELRARFGEYQSDDPNQLCAVASPFLRPKDLRWRWQVVAQDSNHRLCAAVNDIPKEGMPAGGEQVLVSQLPKGECSIEVTVRRDHSGEWQLHAECLSVDSRMPEFDPVENSIDIPKSLVDSWAQSEYPPISVHTSVLTRVDRPIELLRSFDPAFEIAESSAQKLREGVILWIEKNPPVPNSELPPASP